MNKFDSTNAITQVLYPPYLSFQKNNAFHNNYDYKFYHCRQSVAGLEYVLRDQN